MNRRQFLKVTFAAGAALAVPVGLELVTRSPLPTIWGDGVHDDTAGMQAAINGEPFYAVNDCVSIQSGKVHIPKGSRRYKISGNLRLGSERARYTTIRIEQFDAEIGLPDEVYDGDPA